MGFKIFSLPLMQLEEEREREREREKRESAAAGVDGGSRRERERKRERERERKERKRGGRKGVVCHEGNDSFVQNDRRLCRFGFDEPCQCTQKR